MLSSNCSMYVGHEDILRALETALSQKGRASKKQARTSSDVLSEYYETYMASGQAKLRNSAKVDEVVIREIFHCLEEDHITKEILHMMCNYIGLEPFWGQQFIACYKMWHSAS